MNLMAFPTKFTITWRRRPASPMTRSRDSWLRLPGYFKPLLARPHREWLLTQFARKVMQIEFNGIQA